MNLQELCTLIDNRQNELYELLSDLIRINSENWGDGGNEKECSEYIAKLCHDIGLETDLYSPLDIPDFDKHPDYLDGRHLENRPNVTARMKGNSDEDVLMLMGHTDTVVIGDRSFWTCDPLAGEIRDGKIWGRGATDDKYALAVSLFLIRILKEYGFEPKANLLFTAYCDEERGGSHGALAAVLKYPCTYVANLDSANFEINHCGTGGGEAYYRYHTEKPVDNAALTAKAIPIVMEVLESFAKRRRAELQENRFYKDTPVPDNSMRYMGIKAGNKGADLGIGEILFIFYTDKTKEEINDEYRELENVLTERLAPLGIIGDGFFPETRFFHYVHTEPDCYSIRQMQAAARSVSGRELIPCGSCLGDLSVILKYGSQESFSFGIARPFHEYGGAHQPDEFIECDKLLEFTKIMGAYILNILG